MSRDYYEILGLTPNADGNAINQTYWHLARKYQAQVPSDPRGTELLDELNEAYVVLGTPDLRAKFDASRSSDAGATAAHRRGWRVSLPGISVPALQAPSVLARALGWRPSLPARGGDESSVQSRIEAPKPADRSRDRIPAPLRRATSTVDSLRASTASTIGRWRESAAAESERAKQTPDTTLVDIFRSEQELDDADGEPLAAALNVLRGTREPVKS